MAQSVEELEAAVRYQIVRETKRKARVSIGIPTYNGGDSRMPWLLTSMRQAGWIPEDAALTFLDDGSPRLESRDALVLLAKESDANYIAYDSNRGITAGWNDLSRFVDSEYVILINDDILVTKGWYESLMYFLENNDCGAASPNLWFCEPEDLAHIVTTGHAIPRHPVNKGELHPEWLHQDADEGPAVVMCSLGCLFGFKRSVFETLGGFDERMVQMYNESYLGTIAARDLRFPSYCIPYPKIWHLWSATFRENPEVTAKASGDRQAYIDIFGGDFQGENGTHPRFMTGMPPRIVKWLDKNGQPRERMMEIR